MFIGLKCAIIHFLEDLAALSACLFPVLAIHTQTSIKTTLCTHWVTPSTHLSTDRYAQAPTRIHYTKPSDIPLHKFSHKNLHTNSHVQTHIFTYTHAHTHTLPASPASPQLLSPDQRQRSRTHRDPDTS